MAGTEDAQRNETPAGPLIHSFAELARRLAGYDLVEHDAEDMKILVEVILSDYAYREVDVEDHAELGIFELRIGTRGIVTPYPFTRDEVYEFVDELVEIVNDEEDDPAAWDDDDAGPLPSPGST
jgi:hypothetical protein